MSDYSPLQEKFRAAFPIEYDDTTVSYQAVVFERGARIYVIKTKFHIIENNVKNLPFGSELLNYLSLRYVPVETKKTQRTLQYEIPAEDADNVIALLKTGRRASR